MPLCKTCNYRVASTNSGQCCDCDGKKSQPSQHKKALPRPVGHNTPVTAAKEKMEAGQGGAFDKIPSKHAETVKDLIDNFHVVGVDAREAKKRLDHVGKLPGETHKRPFCRIDRQGPSRNDTHAKFAVQIGEATYAGIEMPTDVTFTIEHVRAAFRASIGYGTYARVWVETS
jgi:hypothetical protein